MNCKRPYVRTPNGVTPYQILNEDGRMAATPFGCGQCLHCRINKTRVIQTQNVLESKLYDPNDTSIHLLTYNDENNKDGELHKSDFQKFFKRLRRRLSRDNGRKVRYFGCGEYGDTFERPHYHVILYGVGYQDQDLVNRSWPKGFVFPGRTGANKEFARYCSGYLAKGSYKTDGPGGLPEEFQLQSRKPALGSGYISAIGETLRNKPNIIPEDLSTIHIGKKKFPLGRHLSSLLKAQILDSEKISSAGFQDWQYEACMPPAISGGSYYHAMMDQFSDNREKCQKNHELYGRKQKL